jgi:ligand-binding sensor domain-containing protein/putative methionine-R-sulfoxide reductase with GAF domain
MRHYRLTILFVLIFLTLSGAKGQENLNYFFRHISQSDGLLHNKVLSIVQDGKGFIWIATLNGLQRYDGSRFIYYSEMLSNAAEGLTAGADMYADKKNNLLWITNNTSIEKMELGKNHFTVYDSERLPNDPSFVFNSYQDVNNDTWVVGANAVYKYNSATKKNGLCCLNIRPPNPHQASSVAMDSAGKGTWVASGSQLYFFENKSKKVWSENFNPVHHPLLQPSSYGSQGKFLRYILIDSRRNIWITTWGDMLYKYDAATNKISSYSLSAIKAKEEGRKISAGPLINCMLEDDNHTIWIGTENAGLLRYNDGKDNFDYCITQEKNSESILYNYKIFSLFQDKEQNIWVGTDKGISIFNPYRQYFQSVRHDENNPLSIGKSEMESFIQTTNGDMFIGTWGGGMALYDKNFKFKKNILFNGTKWKNYVWNFQQVDDKTLWIGCQHGYLLLYNIVTGATQTLQPPEMEGSTIRCMEKDGKGNIWFGLHNGKIIKWDKSQNKFLPYGARLPDNIKKAVDVLNIFIDRAQNCWVSTAAGFKQFDLEKMIYINTWLPEKNNVTGISGITCQGIEEYNDSILLIGTIYGGLNIFNKRTKEFSHFSAADRLPANTIYAVKKDSAGFIWFTTDYGLCKFNLAEKKTIPYSIEPGFINTSFTSYKFYPLQDGQWLTLTSAEAISFFPLKIGYLDTLRPKTEITGFKLFDKPVFIDSLLFEKKPVRLSYKQNFFTVEFAALNFSGLQQTNYYYRLAGIDKDWVHGGTKRFASYTDLQPGEYIFNVKAENVNSGGETTSFKIIIVPPFWKTLWFISILFFCTLLLIYLFVKWREKNIKAIETEKLKVQRLNAEQYKNKLELEQIINYFSSSLIDKKTVDDVLWDVAKNLIGRLGFVDCMIYLWNGEKTKMIQKAGFGPKGSIEEIYEQPFDVVPGQGVVGYVMQTKEPVLIPDTSKDSRYRPDEMTRLSEITVPVIYNNELIGVIDSEHHEKNFFTPRHLQILITIVTLMANKIKSIEAEQSLQRTNMEMYGMNEQLSKAKLEALRSQMNPHFIFNCINSIDALIQSNDKYHATVYLNKFAKLIRNILDSSKQNTVTLSKDLDTLRLYIELEQLRHENKFTAEIKADDALLQDDYKVPPLIIQPFVENAILHGIRYRTDNNGKLSVSVVKKGDYLHYVIEDNGVGRNTFNSQVQKEKISYGIDMSNDRVKLFNNEEKASVQIIDLLDNDKPAGTKVEVLLKIQ